MGEQGAGPDSKTSRAGFCDELAKQAMKSKTRIARAMSCRGEGRISGLQDWCYQGEGPAWSSRIRRIAVDADAAKVTEDRRVSETKGRERRREFKPCPRSAIAIFSQT